MTEEEFVEFTFLAYCFKYDHFEENSKAKFDELMDFVNAMLSKREGE